MALHPGSRLGNRVTTTTRTAFGGRRPVRKPIGIQAIRGGRRSALPVSISGGLGGTRLPNVRTSNIRGQVSALRRV